MTFRVRMRARRVDFESNGTSHSAKDASTGVKQRERKGIQMLLGHF